MSANPPSFRIFISAVSREAGTPRREVARVLRRKGLHVRVQEDFRQGGHTLLEHLRDYVRSCEAVICLIGEAHGAEPPPDAVARIGNCAPLASYTAATGLGAASYTQWEFFFAQEEPQRPTYCFFTAPGFAPGEPNSEPDELRQRQQSFRAWVETLGLHWAPLTTASQLIEDVLVQDFPDLSRARPQNLPYPTLGHLFKGRDDFLDELRRHFTQPGRRAAAILPSQAIYGLGGIGKTRAAVEYAWEFSGEYSALLFASAPTSADFRRTMAELCGVLGIEAGQEEPARFQAVLHWLAHPDHRGWLLILDNVDTPEAANAVLEHLASLAQGHVLITSRLGNWRAGVEPRELGVLTTEDATDFLLESTRGQRAATPQDAAEARALAVDLDGLALALEQAAAYVSARNISFARYRQRWQEADRRVREWFDPDVSRYPRSVATTWQTSVEQLSPAAQALLRLLSWLAPEPLPTFLLEAEVAAATLRDLSGDPSADLEEARAELLKFSLLQRVSDAGFESSGRMHRLLQLITRERQTADEQQASLRAALSLVDSTATGDPSDVRTWPVWDVLRPHAAAVAAAGDRLAIAEPTALLMNELGVLLATKASFAEAEPLYRRALAIREESLGTEHPAVATVLNNLAGLLHDTNRLAEAEPLYRRVLTILENSMGTEHPDVAVALNNLALLLRDTNRLTEAEPLYQRALAIWERSLGTEHPQVAVALNNLALLLNATNRLAEAEPLYRRALAIWEKSLGTEHPQVAVALNNLAELLRATNRLAEAEPLFRRALAIDEASFGPHHPNVATDLNNLALLLRATNRLAEAEPLFRRALAIDEASFGPHHPNVAIRLNNLAGLLHGTKRLSEAEPLFRRALAIFADSLGTEHPSFQTVGANYIIALQEMGLGEAEIEERLRQVMAEAGDDASE